MNAEADRPGVIAPPPVLYLAAFLLGVALYALWPARITPTTRWNPAALLVMAAGVLLMGFAVRTFRRAGTNVETYKPATAVVTGGPYGFSRNPMYLSATAVYLGLGIALNNLWVVLLVIPLLIVMHFRVILREERYMERKFGDAYLRYKASVRRWI